MEALLWVVSAPHLRSQPPAASGARSCPPHPCSCSRAARAPTGRVGTFLCMAAARRRPGEARVVVYISSTSPARRRIARVSRSE
eukprot:7406942-Pyramimonas_sp.AAC.1